MDNQKSKYLKEYKDKLIQYGIIPDKSDKTHPYCLMCLKSYINEFYRESKMRNHIEKRHFGLINKQKKYFEDFEIRKLNFTF